MSNEKVIKLAIEFTKKLGQTSRDQQFQTQRENLEKFYYDIKDQLRALISEMDGDLSTLKYRNLDKNTFKLFASILHTLVYLTKNIKPLQPYEGVKEFILWAESEKTEEILDDLNLMIQLHIKRTEIDFDFHKSLRQAEINSLPKISWIAHKAKKHIKENPLIQEYRSAPPTLNKEELLQGPEVSIGPTADTIPPPKR